MVGEEGLEPSRFIQPTDFKSVAYTDSATRPLYGGTYGSRTHLKGFADLYVTVPSTRHTKAIVAVFNPFAYSVQWLFAGSK
jgi:hypothetical protein